MPKVSIIMPVYNVESFLKDSLECAMNQTFKDVEIICVNDGSKDNSLQILKEYAKKDNRIIVLDQKNQGPAAARNNGLKIARGDYIWFLDSDDWADTDFVETLYMLAINKNVDLVKGNNVVAFKDRIQPSPNNKAIQEELKISKIPYKNCNTAWYSFLFKNSLIKKYNIVFPDLKYKEDMAFLYKYISIIESFAMTDDVTYYYRKGQDSLTKNIDDNIYYKHMFESRKDVTIFVNKYLKNSPKYQPLTELYTIGAIKYSLTELFRKYSTKDEKAKKCFDIVCETLAIIDDNLLKYFMETNPLVKYLKKRDFGKVEKILKVKNTENSLLEKIFSVKNTENKKVITVLGIKIKHKKRKKKNNIYFVINGQRKSVSKIKGLDIDFMGENATIEICADIRPIFKNCKITIGNNSKVKIGNTKYVIKKLDIFSTADNSIIEIGDDFSCEGAYLANRDEPDLSIKIGNDCMFSAGVYIRTSDGHSILDFNGNLLNKAVDDVIIGNHVWVCGGAKILKESKIPANSIVANNAIVTKKFETPNVILAGSGAKIVKEKITWDRKRPHLYNNEAADINENKIG